MRADKTNNIKIHVIPFERTKEKSHIREVEDANLGKTVLMESYFLLLINMAAAH